MSTIAARNEPFARALGLSVLLHALALTLAAAPIVRETLAAWQASTASSIRLPVQTTPEEIEVMVPRVTVVPPPAPSQSFIRTDGLAESTPSSADSRFISDRHTRAASELPADVSGDKNLPSQQGIDIPVVEVIRTPLTESEGPDQPSQPDALADRTPAPPVTPTEVSIPTPSESSTEAARTPSPPPPPLDLEKIATTREGDLSVQTEEAQPRTADSSSRPALAKTEAVLPDMREPAPELREPADTKPRTKPPPPAVVLPPAGFSSLREPTRQHGTITNRGPASVDAADTPVGRYMKEVTGAIEREWHRKRRSHADFVTYGTIKLEFSVNRLGQVQSLTIKNRNGANAVMQDFTLNAVLDAKIPPMPAGLPEIFDHDRLQISYDIIVY